MKRRSNSKYILQNLEREIPMCYWIMYIDNFFGKEKAEEFYKYLIDAHKIMRKNDIRKIISNISLSVYSLSAKEQIAFFGIYKPIDINNPLIEKIVRLVVRMIYLKHSRMCRHIIYHISLVGR